MEQCFGLWRFHRIMGGGVTKICAKTYFSSTTFNKSVEGWVTFPWKEPPLETEKVGENGRKVPVTRIPSWLEQTTPFKMLFSFKKFFFVHDPSGCYFPSINTSSRPTTSHLDLVFAIFCISLVFFFTAPHGASTTAFSRRLFRLSATQFHQSEFSPSPPAPLRTS